MPSRAIAALVLCCALLTLGTGCKWVKSKMGWGWTIENPEEETPEWVVQQVLKAAHQEPFDEAWANYSRYLHSDELNSPVAMKEWETLRFPALRRKHVCFMRPTDADEFAFEIKEEIQESEEYIQLRVTCKTTDMPTPCHLKQDPEAGNKWRVKYNCMN